MDSHVAQWVAFKAGCGRACFVNDVWGGYWQANWNGIPYTFRLK